MAISSNDPLAIRLDELGYTDLGDSFEDMKVRASEHNFNFPYLYDGETQSVAKAYCAQATPHVFVLDKARKVRYQGRFDDTEKPGVPVKTPDVVNAVTALLAGEEVANPLTKTFGCSMKFSDKRHYPDLLTIHRMYRGRDFEFVTLSMDDPGKPERVEKFLKGKAASGANYLFDGEDKYALTDVISPDWRGALPYTLIVEPGGKVIYSQQGLIDPYEVKKVIVGSTVMGRYY